IGIVLLPDLSRKLRAGDLTGSRHALNRAAEMSMALTLPCAVALIVIPAPLVEILFQRGTFGAADTASTAAALGVYALGLPAFVLQKVLQPLFFAREDTGRPFRYALVSLTVNIGLAFGLAPAIGYLAAALGATCAAWSMVVALMWGARNMGAAARFDARFKARVWRMGLSSAIMGAALWGGMSLLEPALDMAGARYGALGALILLGMVVYFGACEILGAVRFRELRVALRR
ncbi:MAG: lipid II flippase MurJ, partial [Pseudomonadota bacterium]